MELTLREYLNLICKNVSASYSNNAVWNIRGHDLTSDKGMGVFTIRESKFTLINPKIVRNLDLNKFVKEELESYEITQTSEHTKGGNYHFIQIESESLKKIFLIFINSKFRDKETLKNFYDLTTRNAIKVTSSFCRSPNKKWIKIMHGRMILRISGNPRDYEDIVEISDKILARSQIYEWVKTAN